MLEGTWAFLWGLFSLGRLVMLHTQSLLCLFWSQTGLPVYIYIDHKEPFVDSGHCLVTLSLIINEILKWLSSLPVLMQESFWW